MARHQTAPISLTNHVLSLDRFSFAYICLDEKYKVASLEGQVKRYGFASMKVGDAAIEHFEFLTGILGPDLNEQIELPLVTLPSNIAANILITPDDSGSVEILISDASKEYQQLQLLQQKANEVELLTRKQQQLLSELESANGLISTQNEKLTDANRLQSDFLAGVSHEFRTPLFSILGYNEIISQSVDPSNKPHIESINRAGKHLMSLVENLLDFGKIQSEQVVLNPASVELLEVLRDVQSLLQPSAASKSVEFTLTSDIEQDLWVFADELRLRQCLINIVSNAIKFTDKGSVKIDASYSEDTFTVVVKDTGIGMTQDDLKHIYTAFWQATNTGKVGTGLGMSITKEIIELMGGDIAISSSLGKGTQATLSLILPQIDSQSLPESAQQERDIKSQGLNILMAEDDSDVAELLMLLLEEQGHTVEHVKNGQEVLNRLNSNSYQLLLMDVHMPVLDGIETVRRLRDDNCELPVIIMTASTHERERQAATAAGSNGYLVKPIDMHVLGEITSQILSS